MTRVEPSGHNTSSSISWRSAGLFAVRYGIGGVMVLAGIVVLAVVPGDLGAYGFASAIGAGLSVVLLNLLYRLSVSGDREREREEEARRYLDEHGFWPDDEETPQRPSTRRWILPRGVVLPEQAAAGRSRAARSPRSQSPRDVETPAPRHSDRGRRHRIGLSASSRSGRDHRRRAVSTADAYEDTRQPRYP